MKKEYLKPEADYLELYTFDELANDDGNLGMSTEWGEGEIPEDW